MNTHIQTGLPMFSATGVFLSETHCSQFGRLLAALCSGQSSVLVTSHAAVLVEHYGEMLRKRLQAAPGVIVESYAPGSSSALLNRFNSYVDALSVDDARSVQEGRADSVRVLVIHDADALVSDELALLGRLLKDFPGARIVTLLMDHGGTSAVAEIEKALKGILRVWTPEVPEAEALEAVRIEAQQAGYAEEFEDFIRRLPVEQARSEEDPDLFGDDDDDSYIPVDLSSRLAVLDARIRRSEEAERLLRDSGEDISDAATTVDPEPAAEQAYGDVDTEAQSTRGVSRILLLGIGALISLIVLYLVKGDATDRLSMFMDHVRGMWTKETSSPAVALAPVEVRAFDRVSVTPVPVSESLQTLPGEPDAGVADGVEEVSDDGPLDDVPEVADTDPLEDMPAVTEEQVTETAIDIDEPNSLLEVLERGREIVRTAAGDSWFVQVGLFAEQANADAWHAGVSTLPLVENVASYLVPVNSAAGQLRYLAVFGPFSERDEADRFVQENQISADYWIRQSEPIAAIVRD